MKIEEFIEKLKRSPDLREEFLWHPEKVAKKYGFTLAPVQLKKLSLVRQLEKDPLLKVCMCPISGGTIDVVEKLTTPRISEVKVNTVRK